ncbi:hypothetical protein ABMA28_009066 [Loxostege sticticalis]|uniref:Uncharacterized protein n=1 Tax=Loxostege sticticalis TaxID=481309 RepID=A0ABD0SGB0_LOXSC
MPRLFHLDHYEECLAARGVYCVGSFELAPDEPRHQLYQLMEVRYYVDITVFRCSLLHVAHYEECLASRGVYCVGSFELAPDEPRHQLYQLMEVRHYVDITVLRCSLFHVAHYEECLAVRGVYCVGSFELAPDEPRHQLYQLMEVRRYVDITVLRCSLFHVAHYEECLAARGVYCVGSFELAPDEPRHQLYQLMEVRHYVDITVLRCSLFHVAHYEECLAVRGVYCVGSFELAPDEPRHQLYQLMEVRHYVDITVLRCSLFHVAHYEECLAVRGVYCVGSFELAPDEPRHQLY